MSRRRIRLAFSLPELLAVVMILAIVAACLIPRAASHVGDAKRSACFATQGNIELQAKLWRRNNGSYPAADLSNIGANVAYFPEGIPSCPVDGTAYTIDTTSGQVNGHAH
jgi:prepilin-type N-terminal cleavage/methylation domain-containing protein